MTETQAPQAETAETKTRKKRNPVPELGSLLGGNALTAEPLAPGTAFARSGGRSLHPRNAEQKKLDEDGKKLYDAWVKGGKPADADKCPKIRYVVNPAAVDALVAYLRRVTDKGGPLPGKRMIYRKAPHASGRVAVTVIYTDPVAKKDK